MVMENASGLRGEDIHGFNDDGAVNNGLNWLGVRGQHS